jgi:hypothetical protein
MPALPNSLKNARVKTVAHSHTTLEPPPAAPTLEPLLPAVRRAAVPILVLTISNGAFLFGTPQLAETWYAWVIKPPLSAAFMGTGYLIGMVGILLTLFVIRSWQSVLIAVNAFFALSALHVAVTLLHADRFRWDYPLTWAWIAVYSSIPLGIVASHRRQQRNRSHQSSQPIPSRPGFDLERALLFALGSGVLIVSAALFVAPLEVGGLWAWTLTPLTARITSSWYAFMGLLLVLGAVQRRQPHRVLLSNFMLCVWSVLLLSLPVLHASQFKTGGEVLAWLGVHAVLLVTTAWATVRAWRRMKLEQLMW